MNKIRRSLSSVTAFAILMVAAAACAQNYPNRPIRMIVPFPPGGSVDVIARIVALKLSESLGQQIVIDNRGGASGNIGAELVARATPDGYTLLAHTVPFTVNPFLYSTVPYDTIKDFTPVCLLSESPVLLVVHPSVPAKTVRELIELAKSQPGKLNYASAGVGTNHHIAGELLSSLAKINIMAVQYKGGGPAQIATLGGEVGITYPNVVAAIPFIKSDRLRALGITSAKRSAAIPELPTIAEAGLPGYEFTTWHGLLAPAGLPKAVLSKLSENLRKVMRAPDLSERFEREGVDIVASTSEQFSQHLKSELQKWSKLVKERGMRAD
jgi:tripartite-type tricarboxylate transporter receptor subunit TctC